MRIKRIILMAGILISASTGAVSMAATYTAQGFIAKSFNIKNGSEVIATVTGSVLYQKGTLKDTIVFEGITTNQFTSEFTGYVGNKSSQIQVNHITLPLYNGAYKYRYETKENTKYTYGKLKIYSSHGTNYLKATQ